MRSIPFSILLFAGGAGAATVSPHGLTFTLDPAATAVGSFEMESGLNAADGSIAVPLILKYSPWADYELAVVGEAYAMADGLTGWDGELGGSATTLLLRHPFHRGDWTLGIIPRITLFTDAPGEEYGLTLSAMHAIGPGGITANLGYSHATDPATDRVDLMADVYRPFGSAGTAAQLSWFAGIAAAFPDGGSGVTSLGVGLSYRPEDAMQFDLALRQEDVGGADAWRVLFGTTMNFGR